MKIVLLICLYLIGTVTVFSQLNSFYDEVLGKIMKATLVAPMKQQEKLYKIIKLLNLDSICVNDQSPFVFDNRFPKWMNAFEVICLSLSWIGLIILFLSVMILYVYVTVNK